MRLFGSDNISGIMDKLGMEEDEPIEHKLVTKSIESAQKKVEARNFTIRKQVLEYDNVMNQQREVIYSQRRKILQQANLRDTIMERLLTAPWRCMLRRKFIPKTGICRRSSITPKNSTLRADF